MARTAEGAALTAKHRRDQLALRARTLRDLATLWPIWRLDEPGSYETFAAAVAALITARNRESAELAADYYRAFRSVERVDGRATVVLAEPPPWEVAVTSISVTARAGTLRALRGGLPPESARRNGFVMVSGAVGRHVMNGGRSTIVQSVAADRQAQGFARVAAVQPCAFCARLVALGPIYKSDQSAEFQAHDHCACTAEPRYRGSAWPNEGRALELRGQWNEATRGLSGRDALNAFRSVLEV